MDLEIAVFFIIFIILVLWEIKADFFLLIFGVAAYIFLLIYIVTSEPLTSISAVLSFLFLNPFGIFFMLTLIGVFWTIKIINKKKTSKLTK